LGIETILPGFDHGFEGSILRLFFLIGLGLRIKMQVNLLDDISFLYKITKSPQIPVIQNLYPQELLTALPLIIFAEAGLLLFS
jgi:hypothetical protein